MLSRRASHALTRLVACGALLVVSAASAATVYGASSGERRSVRATVNHRAARDSAGADPIARLSRRIASGRVSLAHDSALGYLPALLRELRIPMSSQGLVFSRTSLQTDKIAPWTPRAVYFNDDVYVGYVQESDFLEIAAIDPVRGPVFYTMSQRASPTPAFAREGTTCLMCHQSALTDGVPGLMVRSTVTDRLGYPIGAVHEGATTDATPLPKRWGGWYVTGTHGQRGHAGNVYAPSLAHEITDRASVASTLDMTAESERLSLGGKFDTTRYLTGTSDIVALMVLAHQAHVHNRITATALAFAATGDAGSARVQDAVDRLVSALLFAREAPLTAPVRGTSGFSEQFAATGVRDPQGRSLRDLDLERRLFRYPLSFLIYSESFDALPTPVRHAVYARVGRVLRGDDVRTDLPALGASERAAIDEILRATRPEYARLVRD